MFPKRHPILYRHLLCIIISFVFCRRKGIFFIFFGNNAKPIFVYLPLSTQNIILLPMKFYYSPRKTKNRPTLVTNSKRMWAGKMYFQNIGKMKSNLLYSCQVHDRYQNLFSLRIRFRIINRLEGEWIFFLDKYSYTDEKL